MKIFISYSWTPEENKKRVIQFAQKLKKYGFDIIIDQTHLKFGYDKYVFMERMVTDPAIDKVFIICNKDYAEKADKRQGGVGDESMIITPEIYGKTEQSKFIPIVFEKDSQGKAYLPSYLKRIMYVDLVDGKADKEAYWNLLIQLRQPYFDKICDCFNKMNIKYEVYFHELRASLSLESPLTDSFTVIVSDDGMVIFCSYVLSEIPVKDVENISFDEFNDSYGSFIFQGDEREDEEDDRIVNLFFMSNGIKLDSETLETEIMDFLDWLKQNYEKKAIKVLTKIFSIEKSTE